MKSEGGYLITRKHKRFTAKPRALVLLHREGDPLPHHIVQIGKGGLSFRYLGQKLKPSEIAEISIYHENELIVDSIPVKPVSDFLLRGNLVPIRCSSVCFSGLNSEQNKNLDRFIQNYTEN
jgi:hypothetical protein